MTNAFFKFYHKYLYQEWHEWGPFEEDRWKKRVKKELDNIAIPYTEDEIQFLYEETHKGFVWR